MTSRTDIVGQNGNDAEVYHHLHRHGHRPKSACSPTYSSWLSMRYRCTNENSDNYHLYGGRGISICDRWNDFVNFLADMGERPPGTSLDRVDPDGNYTPSNCRWATPKQQARNRRNSLLVEIDGVLISLVDLAEEFEVPKTTIYRRYKAGLRGSELVCRANRNRLLTGESKASSKLTAAAVLDIRRRHAAGARVGALAKDFAVSQPTINDIVRRSTWKHV